MPKRKQLSHVSPDGKVCGFDVPTPQGKLVHYRAAQEAGPLSVKTEKIEATASALLVMTSPTDVPRGVALDCAEFTLAGRRYAPEASDFEFAIRDGPNVA